MNQVLDIIASRRSHRAYENKQITEEQLQTLLQAAVQAPSAVNGQPWHFTAVQNDALLTEINEACRETAMKMEESQRSPRFADPAFHVFYHAPTVIFLSAAPENGWAKLDCGIAVQTIALAAESLGLGSVILGLPRMAFQSAKAEALREKLCFPQGHDFMIAIAIGTPADDKEAHPVGENKISVVK